MPRNVIFRYHRSQCLTEDFAVGKRSDLLGAQLHDARGGSCKTRRETHITRGVYLRSFRTIAPPFITNFTRSSSVMSLKGFPATAMMSAYLPFSIDPIRSCQPIISAATVVAVWMACAGDMPYLTR